jgi:hypothetical protein
MVLERINLVHLRFAFLQITSAQRLTKGREEQL